MVNYTEVLKIPCRTCELKGKLNCSNYGQTGEIIQTRSPGKFEEKWLHKNASINIRKVILPHVMLLMFGLFRYSWCVTELMYDFI